MNIHATIEPITFRDIGCGQCRWPVGPKKADNGPDMQCCGLPVVDRFAPEGRREATHCTHHLDISQGNAWQGGHRW